ncbi:hypothetical protein [Flavobacterium sp.]|uniref:hypothetical protein n=1 Tax=Flavobacterium sp. TaxID=239 RepID=UPI0037522287
MILSFSTQLNGKPTYFPEKILTGLEERQIISFDQTEELFKTAIISKKGICHRIEFSGHIIINPKLHTIREDKNNRWQVGNKIDFFINARQKNMFRFAPVLPVVSIQEIEIKWLKNKEKKIWWYLGATISINNVYLSATQCEQLAINDGFDSVIEFFEYFNKDFHGKIIHWTDLKY